MIKVIAILLGLFAILLAFVITVVCVVALNNCPQYILMPMGVTAAVVLGFFVASVNW